MSVEVLECANVGNWTSLSKKKIVGLEKETHHSYRSKLSALL